MNDDGSWVMEDGRWVMDVEIIKNNLKNEKRY